MGIETVQQSRGRQRIEEINGRPMSGIVLNTTVQRISLGHGESLLCQAGMCGNYQLSIETRFFMI
ncbi:hypothetical protein T35B1_18878 [Salinisphaera shabanensis T35B1]